MPSEHVMPKGARYGTQLMDGAVDCRRLVMVMDEFAVFTLWW